MQVSRKFMMALIQVTATLEDLDPALVLHFFGARTVEELKFLQGSWEAKNDTDGLLNNAFQSNLLQRLMWLLQPESAPKPNEDIALYKLRGFIANMRRECPHGGTLYCGLHELEQEMLKRENFLHQKSACC